MWTVKFDSKQFTIIMFLPVRYTVYSTIYTMMIAFEFIAFSRFVDFDR